MPIQRTSSSTQTLLQIMPLKLYLKVSMENIPHMQPSYPSIQLKFLSRLISLFIYVNIPFLGFQKHSSDVAMSIVMILLSFYHVPFTFLFCQWIRLCYISHKFLEFDFSTLHRLLFHLKFICGRWHLPYNVHTMYWPPVLCSIFWIKLFLPGILHT